VVACSLSLAHNLSTIPPAAQRQQHITLTLSMQPTCRAIPWAAAGVYSRTSWQFCREVCSSLHAVCRTQLKYVPCCPLGLKSRSEGRGRPGRSAGPYLVAPILHG